MLDAKPGGLRNANASPLRVSNQKWKRRRAVERARTLLQQKEKPKLNQRWRVRSRHSIDLLWKRQLLSRMMLLLPLHLSRLPRQNLIRIQRPMPMATSSLWTSMVSISLRNQSPEMGSLPRTDLCKSLTLPLKMTRLV